MLSSTAILWSSRASSSCLHSLYPSSQSVTLGDEEARRRGVQKSVLERKGPPVFTAAAEIESKGRWRIHLNLAASVDALLAGGEPHSAARCHGAANAQWWRMRTSKHASGCQPLFM